MPWKPSCSMYCFSLVFDRYFVNGELLQIVNVSFSDQGAYMCMARSPVDQDRATALLIVLGE